MGTTLLVEDQPQLLSRAERFAGPIPLLVTDAVMPGMSGRELAVRLTPPRPEMKVLFMSGYTGDMALRHGVSRANALFLQKPFALEALVAKVRAALGNG